MVWRVWRLYQLYSLTLTVTRLQANWTSMGVIRLVEDKFPPLRFLETWGVKVKMPWSSFRVKRWCAILTKVLTQSSVQAFKMFSSEEYKLHTVNSNSSLLASQYLFSIFVFCRSHYYRQVPTIQTTICATVLSVSLYFDYSFCLFFNFVFKHHSAFNRYLAIFHTEPFVSPLCPKPPLGSAVGYCRFYLSNTH